jgi:hypothetical protein
MKLQLRRIYFSQNNYCFFFNFQTSNIFGLKFKKYKFWIQSNRTWLLLNSFVSSYRKLSRKIKGTCTQGRIQSFLSGGCFTKGFLSEGGGYTKTHKNFVYIHFCYVFTNQTNYLFLFFWGGGVETPNPALDTALLVWYTPYLMFF